MRGLPKTLGVALCLSLLALLVMGGGSASAAKPKNSATALKALVKQANKLPSNAASRSQRAALKRTAANALRFRKTRPCSAGKELSRFRKVLRGIKVRKGKRFAKSMDKLAALGPASLDATTLLLSSKKTRGCGGGVAPSTLEETKSTVLSSDENGLEVRVELPELNFVPKTGGGQSWTQLVLPEASQGGAPGTPGVPVTSSNFGVPDGATVEVDTSNASTYKVPDVDVFPVQPQPVDDEPPPNFFAGEFAEKPFTIDKDAYKQKGVVPAEPADGVVIGESRDLFLGSLLVPAAQYNPISKALTVIKAINVKVTFNGGPKTFNPDILSPWETPQQSVLASLLNRLTVLKNRLLEPLRRCGEEMLVITNPATRAAADQFVAGKRAQGMRTNVFETGGGAGQIGTTAAQIQTFIRQHLTALLCIHPSYVTIMGDDDLVPTFPGINGIPSDLQYSMKTDTDELPDVSVGRILGNDQNAVATAVTKILNYENSPPTGPMLTRATMAAQFQDDNLDGTENRTFIWFAEKVRNGLTARGVAVDRIYDDSPTATPLKFNDGTDLPAELKKPTFPWDGDGADVTTAWNEGRFMVIHRDHGWSDGWGHPGYGTADVQGLTNGANLPVVLSINCSSGAYDYDETSFAGESLVKANGGSVGVFGDTRDSPSWHNSQIALGFVDAMLPTVLTGEGPSTKQRTGPALINGKLRLAGLAPPSGPGIVGGDGSTRNELYLWHYFGDPSMQMWGGGTSPFVFDLSVFKAVFSRQISNPPPGDPPPYQVVVQIPPNLAGQPFSLLRNGEVIGKGTAGDGQVIIPASFGDGSPKPGELKVAFEGLDAPPIQIPVDGVPKAATSVTLNCPANDQFNSNDTVVINGTLSGAPAGSKVKVEITTASAPPEEQPGRTIVEEVTPNSQGQWSTSVESQSFEDGNWTAKASYAGNDQYAASATGTCTFSVQDNS